MNRTLQIQLKIITENNENKYKILVQCTVNTVHVHCTVYMYTVHCKGMQ